MVAKELGYNKIHQYERSFWKPSTRHAGIIRAILVWHVRRDKITKYWARGTQGGYYDVGCPSTAVYRTTGM
jgi:hypothetical protein